jgi:REP element-mobilizing transposase RayT
MKRRAQLELELKPLVRWGGAREGAGRKAEPRARVWHRERREFPDRHPGLVTLRVLADVPSLRMVRLIRQLERAFRTTIERPDFRVVQYSIQHDHVHLLVEAASAAALSCGMKSIAARMARAVNRVFDRRGAVLDGRYHHRALTTPREVRSALAYVLLNARKHAAQRLRADLVSKLPLDPASSSRWFEGWADATPSPNDHPAVASPRTWLLRTGWRRHGLIRSNEVPGPSRSMSQGACRISPFPRAAKHGAAAAGRRLRGCPAPHAGGRPVVG